jgi:TonB family protein
MHSPTRETAPFRGLQFLVEPEPWLRTFARNFGDLFRPAPAPVWVTAKPAEYWPDALVHRPVAWRAARQSFLGHTLVVLAVYAINLAWLNQPQIVATPVQSSALHYELSEYLPSVTPHSAKPAPPRRARPQVADPEYAVQEIVVTNENHISTRQTIVQPNPMLLKQDVPLPNLIVNAPIPRAPAVSNHRLRELPLNAPPVVPPATAVQSNLHPLIFPPAAAPVVATPSTPVAASRPTRSLPLEGAVIVPPAPDAITRNPQALQLPAQAPPEVAAPATEIAAGRSLQTPALPMAVPPVAPPAPSAVGRNLSNLGLPSADQTAAAPAQPPNSGASAREKEVGQLLVLNARPVAPREPITVPAGNRPGEFSAGPQGHPGATARPEIKAGETTPAADRPGAGAGDIYISAPPAKITANAVIATPPPAPAARPLAPDKTDAHPPDRIDTKVFGTRRHYSMRLSMPNLSSSVGSWTVRFAELNASSPPSDDLSAPEAITKVDPAYPQDMIQDRIEGVVVLYAIIRSDGTVDGVRVLEGFDERLNENARKALQQWRFRPGTRNGQPIDIEAVVRVPFRVRRNPF